jgi:hypothetical protein
MKHIDNTSIYTAEDGKLIVRKADGFIMGPDIDLGSADDIENYEEKEFSEEEIDAFYESIGIKRHKKEDLE